MDSVSYALGINIGESFKKLKIEGLDPKVIAAGVSDILTNNGENAKMTDEESRDFLQSYFMNLQTQNSDKNLKEGEDFLNENKSKEGVVTLPSGLQYKVITEGTGPKPAAEDEVEVHYRGTLLNGDEFDSSYESGQTAKFKLDQVIKGWTEGLQQVKEGSKVMFWIPAGLAYGERHAGDIEPNSTLIFEIELIKVTKDAPKPAAAAKKK
ncbi:MAG: FKBP-type peptidyl-prolyl cis-trans isomerase [Prevotellaceae bacterium]|nr:FKBP-type peptidyl-prolyl cis-trans isomerase [Prevotellaceae bacterium]